jgi:hypothetical protein
MAPLFPLGNPNRFLSHARRVDIKTLADLGAKVYQITDLDRELWPPPEEVWYTVEHTFRGTGVLKMWENSRGGGLFQVIQAQLILAPSPPQQMGGR